MTIERGGIGQKGGPGEECARMACRSRPAIGYNRSTGWWYCDECSHMLNEIHKDEAEKLFGGPLVIIPAIKADEC